MWAKIAVAYIVARLKEKSTIVTLIVSALAAIGVNIDPSQKDAIMQVVIAILAAVGIFTRERI